MTVLAVFFLSLALIGSGILQSGYAINHLDIGARYAGVLMAITNTWGTVAGIAAPYVVGLLTNNEVRKHAVKAILSLIVILATCQYVEAVNRAVIIITPMLPGGYFSSAFVSISMRALLRSVCENL